MPKIIKFLGYYPFGEINTLGQELKDWRMKSGTSIKNLIKIIGMDGTTLKKIGNDNPRVMKKSKTKIQAFLTQ